MEEEMLSNEILPSLLPNEMWVDILCRLSHRERARSRVVCKQWRHLINTTVNRLRPCAQYPPLGFLIIWEEFNPVEPTTRATKIFYLGDTTFAATIPIPCYRLFCNFISGHICVRLGGKHEEPCSIQSLLTGKITKLPPHELSAIQFFALGLDMEKEVYKIVVGYESACTHFWMRIYDSETRSWLSRNYCIQGDEGSSFVPSGKGEYVDKCFFWMNDRLKRIIAYNEEDGYFQVIGLPDEEGGGGGKFWCRKLSSNNGCLLVLETTPNHVVIRKLEKNNTHGYNWSNLFTTTIDALDSGVPSCVSINQRGLVLVYFRHKLVVYDVSHGGAVGILDSPFLGEDVQDPNNVGGRFMSQTRYNVSVHSFQLGDLFIDLNV